MNQLSGKTFLITGGSGFFGGIFKRALLKQGAKCINIDLERDEDSNANLISVQGDICDLPTLEKIFSTYSIDAIFHFAAILAHVKKDIPKLWASNVDGTKNILTMAEKYQVKKIVFTSSNCLYSKNFDYPVTEDEPTDPVEIYGRSKCEGEKILLSSSLVHSVIIRCPTIMDAGRLGLLGILFEFLDEGRKLWMVGDGENKYQFIYAGDLAQACLAALDYHKSAVFNIGSDDVKSFNEVYGYVIRRAGSKSRLVHMPKGPMILGMKLAYALGISPLGPYQYKMIASNFVFDTTKIKKELNFKPTLKNEDMLLKAYEYYHQNKQNILNRTHVSAHKQIAKMGIIKIIKWLS